MEMLDLLGIPVRRTDIGIIKLPVLKFHAQTVFADAYDPADMYGEQ